MVVMAAVEAEAEAVVPSGPMLVALVILPNGLITPGAEVVLVNSL
jgi:hypothetical protein